MPEQTRPLTKAHVSGPKLVDLYNKHDALTRTERDAIDRTRRLIARELRAPMPEELGIGSEVDGLGVSLPDATVVPLQTVNRVGRRRPRVKRPTKGVSPRALGRGTKIEQPLNSLMSKLYPWHQTVDLVLNEAQCAVIVQLEPTHWGRRPRLYELGEDGAEDKTRVRKPYQRAADDYEADYGGTPERKKARMEVSREEWEQDLREYQAEFPPFVIRAFSRRECVPINPRYVGTRIEIDGLIVRQTYTASELVRRKYLWPGMHKLLAEDPSGEVTLYEGWLYDADGTPYVAYHVEGADGATKRVADDGEERAAVIDLKAEYGICRLPVAYRYGLCFPGAQLGARGVPLMAPFESALLLEDSMASAKAVHANNYAFGGWFHSPDPALGPDAHLDVDGNPLRVEVRPNSVTVLPPGRTTPAVHPGTNGDVDDLIVLTRGAVDRRAPGPETEGAGYAQLISRSGVAESLDQVYDAVRELFELSASHLLEAMSAFGETFGPVVVALDEDRAAQDGEGPAELVDVEPGLAGGNFRVLAIFPPEENMPLRQQEAEFVERKLMTRRDFHERRGIEDPEQYEAELLVEEYLQDPERGRPEIWEIAATIIQDERMKKQLELLRAQQITPQGDPMAAIMAGLQGPQGMVPGGAPVGLPGAAPNMTGFGGPTTAQASLAGAIGGAMNAGAMGSATANGAVNPTVPPGPGMV